MRIAERANLILLETVRPSDFVTAFIGVINTETGDVTYTNAGHNPSILMAPSGHYQLLETGGMILGVIEDNVLEEGSLTLGDELLFSYTDGVIDAVNPDGEPFGFKRLVAFISNNRKLPANDLCNAFGKHIRNYIGNAPRVDDVTFLVLKK